MCRNLAFTHTAPRNRRTVIRVRAWDLKELHGDKTAIPERTRMKEIGQEPIGDEDYCNCSSLTESTEPS